MVAPTMIKEHMEVLGADGVHVGTVDQLEGRDQVKLTKDVDQSMKDKNVIVVEDILDTRLTMTYVRRLLIQRRPRALRVATLTESITVSAPAPILDAKARGTATTFSACAPPTARLRSRTPRSRYRPAIGRSG